MEFKQGTNRPQELRGRKYIILTCDLNRKEGMKALKGNGFIKNSARKDYYTKGNDRLVYCNLMKRWSLNKEIK